MNKLWSDTAWDNYLYWQTHDKKTLKKQLLNCLADTNPALNRDSMDRNLRNWLSEDTYEIMAEHHAEEIGGVVHCFSYSLEMARKFIKMGLKYIPVGAKDYRYDKKDVEEFAEHLKELAQERIMQVNPIRRKAKLRLLRWKM